MIPFTNRSPHTPTPSARLSSGVTLLERNAGEEAPSFSIRGFVNEIIARSSRNKRQSRPFVFITLDGAGVSVEQGAGEVPMTG